MTKGEMLKRKVEFGGWDHAVDIPDTKKCSRCGRTKGFHLFNHSNNKCHKDHLQGYCAACNRKYWHRNKKKYTTRAYA